MTQLSVIATKPGEKITELLKSYDVKVYVHQDEDYASVDRYIISDRVVVERFTANSLLSGIKDKTLFTSAIELREQYEVPIFILEGEVNYAFSGFNPQAVRGAITALPLVYGITVISVPDADETSAMIAMIARQEQVGVPEISLVPKRKAADLTDMQRRVVEMLPGCGVAAAKDLLQHFGSIAGIAGAGTNELNQVRGIGAVKADEIRKVMQSEYLAVEAERHLEDAVVASPQLLFSGDVELVGRQHYIFSDSVGRNFIDLVFHDPIDKVLYLVELKLVGLKPDHYDQICGYLEHAGESKRIMEILARGSSIKGVLASVEPSNLAIKDADVLIKLIDKERVIQTLQEIRLKKQNHSAV